MNPPRPYVIKKIACVFMCHTGSRLFATVLQCCSFHTQWCRSIHGNPAESVFHCSHFCMQKNCISQVKKLFPVLHSSFFFFFFFFLLNHFFFFSWCCELAKSFLCLKAVFAGSLSSSIGMNRLYLGWLILCGQEMRGQQWEPHTAVPTMRRGSHCESFGIIFALEVKGTEGRSHR